ncbi:hypothetical protein NLY09_11665 (plasmid) [Burkholderia vietnamiensis]
MKKLIEIFYKEAPKINFKNSREVIEEYVRQHEEMQNEFKLSIITLLLCLLILCALFIIYR